MESRKNDQYYLNKIKENISFILKHMANKQLEEFINDEVLIDSMSFRLIQISENIDKISADFKKKHAGIPWHEIKGLRNRLVHDYGHIDFTIVYNTLTIDVAQLKVVFDTI